MHSPYVALCGDPANFVDPDGRAGIHLSDWTKGCIKDAFLMYGGGAAGTGAMLGIGKVLQGIKFVGSTLQSVLNAVSTISSGVSLLQSISSLSSKFGVGGDVTASWQDDLMGEIRSHSGVGMAFLGAGSASMSGRMFSRSFSLFSGNGDPDPGDGYSFWDAVQLVLDIAGMVPVIGEIADGGSLIISLCRGDAVGASLSTASLIPIVAGSWSSENRKRHWENLEGN
ncbi:MAG: hypothetical protein IPP69_02880 [Flavobacteriales bacterium]|nr:hypothetical protein [Flavobacteriales bacterium]